MDQAISKKLVSGLRVMEANLGSLSHLTPHIRTLSADAEKNETPR